MKTDCRVLNFAYILSNIVPRGKGESARLIGKLGKKWIHHYVKTRHGAMLPILPNTLDVFVTFLKESNSVDYWVFRVANAMLERGGVCYDVGANVGYIALEIANLRASDGVMVYAFEPQPSLAKNIDRASEINTLKNLFSFNMALGEYSGEAGFSEKRHSVHGAISTSPQSTSYKVPIDTIDNCVSSGKAKAPDVVKIDVEGFEYAVLSGASEVLLRNAPTVIFEMTKGTIDFGYSPKLIAELFENAGGGYTYFGVKGGEIDLANYKISTDINIDIVAVPSARMNRFQWFLSKFKNGTIDSSWDIT